MGVLACLFIFEAILGIQESVVREIEEFRGGSAEFEAPSLIAERED